MKKRKIQIKQQTIQENLKRVEEGKPLTVSLAVLNGEFKKEYFKCEKCGKNISESNMSGFCSKCLSKDKIKVSEYNKKYRQKPEVKAKIREYNQKYQQKPEVKAKKREYNKKYYQRPEVKKRMREWQQKK